MAAIHRGFPSLAARASIVCPQVYLSHALHLRSSVPKFLLRLRTWDGSVRRWAMRHHEMQLLCGGAVQPTPLGIGAYVWMRLHAELICAMNTWTIEPDHVSRSALFEMRRLRRLLFVVITSIGTSCGCPSVTRALVENFCTYSTNHCDRVATRAENYYEWIKSGGEEHPGPDFERIWSCHGRMRSYARFCVLSSPIHLFTREDIFGSFVSFALPAGCHLIGATRDEHYCRDGAGDQVWTDGDVRICADCLMQTDLRVVGGVVWRRSGGWSSDDGWKAQDALDVRWWPWGDRCPKLISVVSLVTRWITESAWRVFQYIRRAFVDLASVFEDSELIRLIDYEDPDNPWRPTQPTIELDPLPPPLGGVGVSADAPEPTATPPPTPERQHAPASPERSIWRRLRVVHAGISPTRHLVTASTTAAEVIAELGGRYRLITSEGERVHPGDLVWEHTKDGLYSQSEQEGGGRERAKDANKKHRPKRSGKAKPRNFTSSSREKGRQDRHEAADKTVETTMPRSSARERRLSEPNTCWKCNVREPVKEHLQSHEHWYHDAVWEARDQAKLHREGPREWWPYMCFRTHTYLTVVPPPRHEMGDFDIVHLVVHGVSQQVTLNRLADYFPDDAPAYCECATCTADGSRVLEIEKLDLPLALRPIGKAPRPRVPDELTDAVGQPYDPKLDNPRDCDDCLNHHKGQCPERARLQGHRNRSVRYKSQLEVSGLQELCAFALPRRRRHGAAGLWSQICTTVTSIGTPMFRSNLECLFSIGRPPTWATSEAHADFGDETAVRYDVTNAAQPTSSFPVACTEVEVTVTQRLQRFGAPPHSDRLEKWTEIDCQSPWFEYEPSGIYMRERVLKVCPQLVLAMCSYAENVSADPDGGSVSIRGFKSTQEYKELMLPKGYQKAQSYELFWLLHKHGKYDHVPTRPVFKGTDPAKTPRAIQLFATPLVQSVTSAMGQIVAFLARAHSVTFK